MTYNQIISSIKKNEFAPVYLLHGTESFFIDKLVETIQNLSLTEQEREFNQTIFYGKDAQAQNIVNSAMQYPMMAERRLVLLKEAQQMKDIEDILPYVENPVSSTIFVIAYKGKKYDMRKVLGKAIKKNGIIFLSETFYENKIPSWINTHAKSLGLNITSEACVVMTALLGTDLSKIDNELQKLLIVVDKDKPIDINIIKNNIGLSKEYSVFELSNALGEKNITNIFRIIDVFSTNPNLYPFALILSILYGYFTKVLIVSENLRKSDNDLTKTIGGSPFFVKGYRKAARNYSRTKLYEVFDILKDYDLKSKGVNSKSISQIELIKEMILKIVF